MGNSWTVVYMPEDGGRIMGKLFVEDDVVRFLAMYDASFKGTFIWASDGFGTNDRHAAYIHATDDEFEIAMPRAEITSATAFKKGMKQRVRITMKDGSEFVFDYGMLSTKKLAAAING